MNDFVAYCIPTYKSFDLAYEGILAALKGTLVPDQIIVIDNSGDGSGTRFLTPLVKDLSNVFIWPQIRNLGVAASWNMFHDNIATDDIIIANDDVQVHPYTLEHLVTMSKKQTDQVIFTGASASGNAFSLFLLKQHGYKIIGGFDTKFYPAYFEDNDYDIRAKLLGYELVTVSEATFDHVGSSTMARYSPQEMELHHYNFRRNQNYFISKWGGLPGNTTYNEPFGGVL